MIDTPRTDNCLTEILDAFGYVHQGNCPQRWVNHARELERELNAANAIIRQQQLLEEENLRLQERIKRLEEAGDAMASILNNTRKDWYTSDQCEVSAFNWNEAKEDKP